MRGDGDDLSDNKLSIGMMEGCGKGRSGVRRRRWDKSAYGGEMSFYVYLSVDTTSKAVVVVFDGTYPPCCDVHHTTINVNI